jgi:hypothetical protein
MRTSTILATLVTGLFTSAVAKDPSVGQACGLFKGCTGSTFCKDGICGGHGAFCANNDVCVGRCAGIVCVASAALGSAAPMLPSSNGTYAWNNGTANANCTGKPSMSAGQNNVTVPSTPHVYATPMPSAPTEPSAGSASTARIGYAFMVIWMSVLLLLESV